MEGSTSRRNALKLYIVQLYQIFVQLHFFTYLEINPLTAADPNESQPLPNTQPLFRINHPTIVFPKYGTGIIFFLHGSHLVLDGWGPRGSSFSSR